MEEQIQKMVFNPIIGKIATIVIEVTVIWLIIKMIQRNLFSHFLVTDYEIKEVKKINYRPRKYLVLKHQMKFSLKNSTILAECAFIT